MADCFRKKVVDGAVEAVVSELRLPWTGWLMSFDAVFAAVIGVVAFAAVAVAFVHLCVRVAVSVLLVARMQLALVNVTAAAAAYAAGSMFQAHS